MSGRYRYRVVWRVGADGAERHGEWFDSPCVPRGWVHCENQTHPDIPHHVEIAWLEREQPTTEASSSPRCDASSVGQSRRGAGA